MSKEYDIFSRDDFMKMIAQFSDYFTIRENQGLPFQKIKIISKRWQRPKTSAQHKLYWSHVGVLKKLFIENGTRTNEAEIHEFLKKSVGFTTVLNNVMVTKSISDISEDATSLALNNLIEFVIQFAAENFDVDLESDRCIV